MAQLYYYYGAMQSSKSASLLMVAHNYRSQGKDVLLFSPSIDDRDGVGVISSRAGLNEEAIPVDSDDNFRRLVAEWLSKDGNISKKIYCILVDEAQFLTKEHIHQLVDIVDFYDIPVMCYGLKNDFQNNLFEGSEALLINADKIQEIKTICMKKDCGKKAIMNGRFVDGIIETEGSQVVIGDEQYIPLCRKCYMDEVKKRDVEEENK